MDGSGPIDEPRRIVREVRPHEPVLSVVERFDGRLRRYLARALAAADAADALQEIYVRLTRLAGQSPPPEFNAAYVFKTADSVVRDLFRRRGARGGANHVELNEGLEDEQPSPFEHLLWRQNADRVRTAVGRLPPVQRRILLLHRVDGLALIEIGDRLRIPLRTVQRELSRALAECRTALEEDQWFDAP